MRRSANDSGLDDRGRNNDVPPFVDVTFISTLGTRSTKELAGHAATTGAHALSAWTAVQIGSPDGGVRGWR